VWWLLVALLSLMAPVASASESVTDIRLGEAQYGIYAAEARFVDAEGAFRSAKTWTALIKIRLQLESAPGIRWAMARWTEDDLHQKLIPDWRNVCALMGLSHGTWNTQESCFDFPNGSRIYAVHLKSSQITGRYSKVRGLTVAGFYIDQLEEVPEDVYEEAALRLSQPGFPQQMIVTPNPVPDTHWIARKWPIDNRRQDHQYLSLSIWDNAHNLSSETIRAAETLYPVGHPARRTKLEGRRGMDVRGVPVYTGAFVRTRHVPIEGVAFNRQLPLGEAYDFGFHHPAIVFYQWAPWGWLRVLGGVMGQDMHIDEFLPIVERYREKWFGDVSFIQATCDPAGANENAQGVRGKPVGILRNWYREHGKRTVVPQYKASANMPENRRAAIDIAATYMRHQSLDHSECFQVDPERWALVIRDEAGRQEERFDSYFVDGLELGYVLEEEARHSTKLGTFYVPQKDGWFEHPMNCFEYGIQQHVRELPVASARAPSQHRQFLIDIERQVRLNEKFDLAKKQTDPDLDPYGDQLDGTVPVHQHPKRTRGGRAGY
jgi:terminase large subunit-like protein